MLSFIKHCDKDFIETVQRSILLRVIVYVSLAVNALLLTNLAVKLFIK
ncbi:hypothetical protein HOU08_gp017 [Dickeya phage vB_DsoM_JA29]|uniref:Uncharacterized protein n=1 Tax=Dickeya phage vB_DsoM_JA29 TaxID=2283031 RepID=A0A384ZWV6_9CAUD|nr:hypothetical protein HOU08_gp017 [Dickeya phage vB_DsoM_JA29]AXG66743.1 hypothetical protein JA29_017 [Dickeya phage vB_DsoM_JA29]